MATITPFRPALADLSDIISFDDFYGSAKRKFPAYLSDGIYEQIEKEAIYVYRIIRNHRSHTGIIASASVLDYINGNIKKHENTLAAKEAKMIRLFDERNAMIKPLLLTYSNVLEIDAIINRITSVIPPTFSIPFQEEEHLFWQVEEPSQIQSLVAAFASHVHKSYICDGHHRAKTSELLYQKIQDSDADDATKMAYSKMLVAYFPASEIEIHNYNRLIVSTGGLAKEAFLESIKKIYDIKIKKKAVNPIFKHQLGMYFDGQWYELTLHQKYLPTSDTPTNQALDVHILNQHVLGDILGITDVRTETDIKYVEGPKGAATLERKVKEAKAEIAFNLYPVALEDLIKISDEKATLPPKSTWIEPRMRNGFITQLYFDPTSM